MTKILTVENQSYDLDMVPEEIEDIRYCVLDYSNPKEADYIFVPLVFLERPRDEEEDGAARSQGSGKSRHCKGRSR